MPLFPSFTQYDFRLRNDDGSETTATWVAAINTNASLNVDTNYRVRFSIINGGLGGWTTKTFNLYYSRNGGTYEAIGSGKPVKFAASVNFAQGDDTTQQLSATGTYITDNNAMCESAGATNSGAASSFFEVEFCIQIDSNYVDDGDTIALRVYIALVALNTYSATPSITVVKGGAPASVPRPPAALDCLMVY